MVSYQSISPPTAIVKALVVHPYPAKSMHSSKFFKAITKLAYKVLLDKCI